MIEKFRNSQDQPDFDLDLRVIDAELFCSFGMVVTHGQDGARRYFDEAFDCDAATRPVLWTNNPRISTTFPLRLSRLERHPHSAQSFLPLTGARYLAIVCPELPCGAPDLGRMLAFLVSAPLGIIYGRNVWHAGLQVLDAPASFAVVMGQAETGNDVFHDLEAAVTINDPDRLV